MFSLAPVELALLFEMFHIHIGDILSKLWPGMSYKGQLDLCNVMTEFQFMLDFITYR